MSIERVISQIQDQLVDTTSHECWYLSKPRCWEMPVKCIYWMICIFLVVFLNVLDFSKRKYAPLPWRNRNPEKGIFGLLQSSTIFTTESTRILAQSCGIRIILQPQGNRYLMPFDVILFVQLCDNKWLWGMANVYEIQIIVHFVKSPCHISPFSQLWCCAIHLYGG